MIPKIAVAPPLFVVWLGFGLAPKITVAVLMAFFPPVVISGLAGLRSVDPRDPPAHLDHGSQPPQDLRQGDVPGVVAPAALRLKVAATLAVTGGAVVGEFVGGNDGLGYVILQANGNIDTAMLFAALFIMSALGIVLFAIIQVAERFLIGWHASRRIDSAATTVAA